MINNSKPVNKENIEPAPSNKTIYQEKTKEQKIVEEVLKNAEIKTKKEIITWWEVAVGIGSELLEKTKELGMSVFYMTKEYSEDTIHNFKEDATKLSLENLKTYIVDDFKSEEIIATCKEEIPFMTGDSSLFPFAQFVSKTLSNQIWPGQKSKVIDFFKEMDKRYGDPIIQFINQNEKIVNDIIETNTIAIIGNLGERFALDNNEDRKESLPPGTALSKILNAISKIIDDEAKLVSEKSVNLFPNEKKTAIKKSLEKVTKQIIDAALPNGAKSLKLPGLLSFAVNLVFPVVKDKIAELIQTLYMESLDDIDEKNLEAKEKVKELTGLTNIDELGTKLSTMSKKWVSDQINKDDKSLQETIESLLPTDLEDRKLIASSLVMTLKSVYGNEKNAKIGSVLMTLLDTNALMLLSAVSKGALEGKDNLDQKHQLVHIISYWIGKAKELSQSDSQPISEEQWKEFLKDLPIPTLVKELLPSLIEQGLPEIKIKEYFIPKSDLRTYLQNIEKQGSENIKKLNDVNIDQTYELSSLVESSQYIIEKNQSSIRKTLEEQVQNYVTDRETSKWIVDNIMGLNEVFNPENKELNETLNFGISIGNGFLASIINSFANHSPIKDQKHLLLPGFLSSLNNYLKHNKVTLDEVDQIEEAFKLKAEIEQEKDIKKKQLLIEEMHPKAAPLIKILKHFSGTLFDSAGLNEIEILKTLRDDTLPLLLFDQFGEMALPLLKIKNNEKILDEELCGHCDKLISKTISLVKKSVNSKEISEGIALSIIGDSKEEKASTLRTKLAEQLESLMKNQDNPIVWDLVVQVIRGNLLNVMGNISSGSDNPLRDITTKIAEATKKSLTDPKLSEEELRTLKKIYKWRTDLSNIESRMKIRSEKLKKLKPLLAKMKQSGDRKRLRSQIKSTQEKIYKLELNQVKALENKASLERDIKKGIKPLLSRFQGISDEIFLSIGWDNTMPVPQFIKANLKDTLLPTFILDQSANIIFLHTEKDTLIKSLEGHTGGKTIIELVKFATKQAMLQIESISIDGKFLNDLLLKNGLKSLSETHQKTLGTQLNDLFKNKKPSIAREFLNDHIELTLLKIVDNIGKTSPEEDITVLVTEKLMDIFDKNLMDGSDIKKFENITNELLLLAGIDDVNLIPGIPLLAHQLILPLIKSKAPQILLSIYEKRPLATDEQVDKVLEKVKTKLEDLKIDTFCKNIGNIGSQIVCDTLSNRDFIIKQISDIVPEGDKLLGASILEAGELILSKKSVTSTEAKKSLSNFNTIFVAELLGNVIPLVDEKDTVESNTNLFIRFINLFTKLVESKIETNKLNSDTFYSDLGTQAANIFIPEGVDSDWMKEYIPEEMREPIMNAIQTKGLPKMLEVLVNTLLTPETLRTLWVEIFKSVNATLEAPITFSKKEEISQTVEEKALTEKEKKLEQDLNKACGEAFMALSDKIMPKYIANFTKSYAKDKVAGLVGSAIRGMLTEKFWMNIIKASPIVSEKPINFDPNAAKVDSNEAITNEEAITEEIHKTADLLYTYPIRYVWAKIQSILDSIFAVGGRYGVEFKKYLDIACRFVFITVIGTIIQWIVSPLTWIRKKITDAIADKGRKSIKEFTEGMLANKEMREQVFGEMWQALLNPDVKTS